MARIIFSHGNSFPASTYKVMFDNLRQRGFEVDAVEKFGHDPQYPVTNNWPHLVQQLADFARDKQNQYSTFFGVRVFFKGNISKRSANWGHGGVSFFTRKGFFSRIF